MPLYHWANQTGHYENLNDYVGMCPACHYRFDRRRVAVIDNRKLAA